MMQVSSSGVELLDAAPIFDGPNLLEERIGQRAATYTASVHTLKHLAVLALISATLLPYLWIAAGKLRAEARAAGMAAAEASRRYEAVKRQAADQQPAIQYAERLQVTRQHRERWLSVLHSLEEGVGPSGFVSGVSIRSLPGAFETTVNGEASSLTEANRWLASLRLRPEYRDVAIARVQPAEKLRSSTVAVRYELRGKVRVQ
ncbi:MAG: hypothetical protein HRF45_04210 [Fimbriimonadia bacterium]|jgi:hypothetical protein